MNGRVLAYHAKDSSSIPMAEKKIYQNFQTTIYMDFKSFKIYSETQRIPDHHENHEQKKKWWQHHHT